MTSGAAGAALLFGVCRNLHILQFVAALCERLGNGRRLSPRTANAQRDLVDAQHSGYFDQGDDRRQDMTILEA